MILVTGGTGLLGSHLLYQLSMQGKRIRALKRKGSDIAIVQRVFSYYSDDPDELFSSIEWAEGDILDYASIEDALDGIDEVYHCAAVVSFDSKDHGLMKKVNTGATANLVNLCLHGKVKKFCHVSSIATLGRTDNDGLTDEETYWKTSSKNSFYSVSKYGAEREVWRAMEEGLNAVIVNPSVILGPGFWHGNSGLFRLVDHGLRYYTEGVNGYVDVRDVAKAMILLMDKEIFNNRFILSSENLSYRELFSLMAKYLGKKSPGVNVPQFMAGIAWRLEFVRCMLTGNKPEITSEMATTATQKFYYSNDKIKRITGFEFMTVEESVKDICEIYKSENRISKNTN